MGTKIRLIALVLAVSLTMNMVIMPVKAEDIAAQTESSEPTSPTTESSEPISLATESSEPTSLATESSEPTSPTTESSEPTSPTTESSEPTSPTTESSEPGAGEESSDLPEQLLTPEEEETLLEETGESMLFSTLTRAEPAVSDQLKALAEEDASSSVDSSTIQITSGDELYYLAKKVNAAIYQNSTLEFTNSRDGFDVSGYGDFPGLGTTDYPFNGEIQFLSGSKTEFILKKPLFQCLYDSAQMPELILHYAEESSNTPVALFAQEVKRDPNSTVSVGSPVEWSLTLQGDSDEEADVTCTPPLIGTIEEGSSVSLGLTDLINLPVETAGNAGLLCGTLNGSLTLTSLSKREPISVNATDAAGGLVGEMGANGSLTVNLNQVTENDTSKPATLKIEDVSATGNAGGLVGKMVAGATLTINTDVEISGSVTASGGDAGGLVGLAEYIADSLSTVTIKAVTNESNKIASKVTLSATAAITGSGNGGGLIGSAKDIIFAGGLPTITGTGSISGANAGGLIGRYTYSGSDATDVLSEVSQNISGITVNGSSNAGGVFGMLINNSTFTINPTNPDTDTDAVSVTVGGGSTGNVGGLIGNYQAGNLENAALYLEAEAVKSILTSSAATYGGLIGLVGNQDNGVANYIEISNTQTKAIASNASSTDFGGLIAKLTNSGHMVKTVGAVKVSNSLPGSSTCGGLVGNMPSGVLWLGESVDVGDVTTDGNILQNRGWILGSRGNTLVFTDQPNWNYAKENNTNDIGNWGQVLSLSKLPGLLNESGHTVIVNEPSGSNGIYSIGSVTEFAAIALRLQLDNQETGALNIPDDISGDLNITLTSDINLSGTGLTGFQRDYEIGNAAPSVTLTGTKGEGGAYSITLPDITVYIRDNSHKRQGLITKASSLTVTNLEITTPTSKSFKAVAHDGSNYYIGALAAEVTGDIALEGVTGSAVLNITGSGGDSAVGGLIAAETKDGPAKMIFKSCTWNGEITADSKQSGLYMGGFLGRVLKQKAHEVDVNGGTISGKLTREGNTTEARMGAMIGSLIGESIDNPLALTIDGLKVSANVTSRATLHSGALLSYEWYHTNATVKNVTVTDSSLTASSRFGGLVYKGSGYWSIQPTTPEGGEPTPGIDISNSSFEGIGSSGLLVCHAEEFETFGALYLEILHGGYKIGEKVNVTVTGVSTFDEIAGCTIGGTGNGIVSIATANGLVDAVLKEDGTVTAGDRNTYKNVTKNGEAEWSNPNTRYYYNLDSFGAVDNPRSRDINSSQNMVMFSAYSHADDSIQKYFYTTPGSITGIIDLTGYSYYPAEQFVDISGATIKFAFKDINDKEKGNKPLDDSNQQHAGMHTGIFTGVSGGGTVNVGNLILQGTVGGLNDNYGALIRDHAQGGSDTSNMADLKIKSVTLDGIMMVGTPDDGVKPLLINSLGSYTSLTMSTVTTTAKYTGMTQNSGSYAASSLIGAVGSSTASYVQLEFKDMRLDGRINADSTQTKVHETYRSIFSKATFLESFQYGNASTCRGVYNFNKSTDDVPSYYTLGKELSNTTSGRNQGLQYWFFDTDDYVCGSEADADTAYATGYLPYVCHSEEDKWHELDVNLKSREMKGCGTYSDPYIINIEDGSQLVSVMEAIRDDGIKNGWTIHMDPAVFGNPFSSESEDVDDKHPCVEYTCANGEWTTEATGKSNPTPQQVLSYLRNAYYMIQTNITISSKSWAGLGTSDDAKAFSGVIAGSNHTITINATGSETQFGGLIKFSLGSVIKDVNIVYQTQPQVNTYVENGATNIPSTTTNASFFGGVVGWCLGGDTIIDNVTVTYQNGEPAVSGKNDHLTAVGGYVGMVGGGGPTVQYGGGVVFRGAIGRGLSEGNATAGTNYFYHNPYVGRVLDGYVMSEGATLTNTDKNYTIPTINKPSDEETSHLSIDGNTVNVNSAEGLWLLSAIANSGAGSIREGNCWAYTKGKARTGTYLKIGDTMPEVDKADESYLGGTENQQKTTSYLTAKYATDDFSNLCSTGISIVLNSDCDMSGYGNGFRGIGASYATNADNSSNYRLIPVSSITSAEGKTCIITLGQDRKEYTDEKDNWTSIGSGLFVLLRVPSTGFTASNLTFKGRTGIAYYTGLMPVTGDDMRTYTSGRVYEAGAGALAANLANGVAASITVDNVKLDTLSVNVQKSDDKTIRGSTHAGGLFGSAKFNYSGNSPVRLKLQDCTYSNLTVIGRDNAGGFLGYVEKVNAEISYTKSCEPLTNGNISTTLTLNTQKTGVGGLMGYWYGKDSKTYNIAISGVNENNPLTMTDLTLDCGTDNSGNDLAFCGGLAGLWYANNDETVTTSISHVSIQGNIQITGGSGEKSTGNTGGLVGAITNNLGEWKTGTSNMSIDVSDVHIADNPGSAMIVERSRQIGAVFGVVKVSKTVAVRNLYLGAEGNSVTVANRGQKNDQSAGGVIGIGSYTPTITMENLHLDGVTILGHYNTSISAGMVIGRHHNQNGSMTMTMDMKNVELRNCTIAVDHDSSYAGLLYGQIHEKTQTITGSNILIKDCTVGLSLNEAGNAIQSLTSGEPGTIGLKKSSYASYEALKTNTDYLSFTKPDNVAIFGGKVAGTVNVKLVGVSIQQQENTLPMKDFGTNPGSYYVVRADYTGAANGYASQVTTSPLSPLGTLGSDRITGDGASFTKNASGMDTTTPVGTQILENLKDPATNLNLKHSAARAYGDDATKAYDYLLKNSGKAFFGDFKQQGGNADYSDVTDASKVNFPVLTLVTNSSVDANKLIYSWISLLTNRTINTSSEGVTITPKRYEWSGNAWVIDTTPETETKLPLQFDGKTFSLNKGVYDSGQSRFTLLDVAFADPAGGNEPAYHLYIPVIVQKMLRFRFWASAQTGTTYIKSSYMTQKALAAASHGQQVTVLMGFEYKRTPAQWKEAVNNGDNLLFGFGKTIQLDGDSLPNETRLTLVDCANQNKVYYATGSEIEDVQGNTTKHNLSFTKFDGWSPVNLCDMLELSVGTSPGQYYQLENVTTEEAAKAADATLRVWNGTGYDYYKYYAEEDENRPEGTGVSITVGWNPETDDDLLREQYYLTIQTPDAESAICNNQIVCSNSLDSLGSDKLPTLRENNESGNKYTRNGNENRVLIGDFFTQEVAIDTVENPEMSTANHTIDATLTSQIRFSSSDIAKMFGKYTSEQKLFQSFELRMREVKKQGKPAQSINLVPGTRITAEYFLDGVSKGTKTYTIARSTPSFRLDFPEGVDFGTWDENNGATFRAKLKLEYPDAAILAQFPLVNGEHEDVGVNLGTNSYLAYTQEALPTTTIHDDAEWDTQNFYRRDFKAASLNYYPVKRTENSTVESVNQLGVNGWNQQNGRIYSAATYDASALDDAGNAKTLRCTLRLKQKATVDSYVEVDGWADYLAEGNNPAVSVYYNRSDEQANVVSPTPGGNDYAPQFELEAYDKDVPIEIQVDMNVLTGADFEAEDKAFYANYKVEMCVELLDSTGTNVIAGSRAEDYIVYTNARINPNPIR